MKTWNLNRVRTIVSRTSIKDYTSCLCQRPAKIFIRLSTMPWLFDQFLVSHTYLVDYHSLIHIIIYSLLFILIRSILNDYAFYYLYYYTPLMQGRFTLSQQENRVPLDRRLSLKYASTANTKNNFQVPAPMRRDSLATSSSFNVC